MQKIDKILITLFILTLLGAVGTYAYFEFISPLPEAPMASAPHFGNFKYMCEVTTDLLAIGFIYLATRLITLRRVQRSIAADTSRYAKWALVRWLLLFVVIYLGLGVTYLLQSPSTVGCPIIGCLSVFFVWPTPSRREHEIDRAVQSCQ